MKLALTLALTRAKAFGVVGVVLALVAASGTASAQDSVSRNANGGNGLPGDGLIPWGSVNQRTRYVVDLTPFTTASGTPLGLAPIAKSSRITTTRFTAINGTSVISSDTLTNANLSAATFARWTQPGGGTSPTENNAALNTNVSGPASATAQAVAWMDFEDIFSGTTAIFSNQILGAELAFDPAQPARFFVTRTVAAQNASSITSLDTSQFGLGGVDAFGNVVFRADGFGVAATSNVLVGDNYFRTRLALRSTANNPISQAGAGDAASTTRVLNASTVTHATPSLIPFSLAGRSVLVASDFAGNLRTETSINTLTSTTLHRPTTIDHRGPVGVLARSIFTGSVATGITLARSSAGGGRVDAFSVFGLTSTGTTTQSRTIVLPSVLTDTCDPFSWNIAASTLRGYDSQVTFRGGNGPAAVGRDLLGNALVAGVAYAGTTPDPINPFNAVVVGRFSPASPTSPVSWTMAAWVDPGASNGKPIFGDFGADGTPGTLDAGEGDGQIDATPIGRLAALTEGSVGGSGPSISSPAFDAAGNVYFTAMTALNRRQGQTIVQDRVPALVRAVYDPATFCYRLDLVARVGQVFAGQNSGRNYRLAEIHIADADSVSSSALWSGSTSALGWNNIDTAQLPTDAPQHLGGLVLSARIEYDADADADFEDPTAFGGNSASADEAYNVLLYIANITPPTPPGSPCNYDFNQDENVDLTDAQLMAQVAAGVISADPSWLDGDLNGDENADLTDAQILAQFVASGTCPI
jgi:hypothetical protein